MKKITLLLVAVAMISGGAFAQDKACCKKGSKCAKHCAKDNKNAAKETPKTTQPVQAANKKTS